MTISPVMIFSISIVLCVVLAVEAAYLVFAKGDTNKNRINRRMKVSEDEGKSQRDILIKLRKERGMDEEGGSVLPLKKLNKLTCN